MGVTPALPPDYDSWTFDGGTAAARIDVVDAVRAALDSHGALYAWASAQPGRVAFQGRGAAFGVTLGGAEAVVRHARRGGAVAPLLGDRFVGAPRAWREIRLAADLLEAGVPTPPVLAAAVYPAGLFHRADVATARAAGRDLHAIFFGPEPPEGERRTAVLHAAGRLVRKLHAAGWVHPDLQLRNVLVDLPRLAAPPFRLAAWLLDVDTCRPSDPADRSARSANIARFFRSWDKWNAAGEPRLTPHDRLAFTAAVEGRA